VTRNCNGDSAYANGFPILVKDLVVSMLRIFAAKQPYVLGEKEFCLDGCLGFGTNGSLSLTLKIFANLGVIIK